MNFEKPPQATDRLAEAIENTREILAQFEVDLYDSKPDRWIDHHDERFNSGSIDEVLPLDDINHDVVGYLNDTIGEGFWGVMMKISSDGQPNSNLLQVIYSPVADRLSEKTDENRQEIAESIAVKDKADNEPIESDSGFDDESDLGGRKVTLKHGDGTPVEFTIYDGEKSDYWLDKHEATKLSSKAAKELYAIYGDKEVSDAEN